MLDIERSQVEQLASMDIRRRWLKGPRQDSSFRSRPWLGHLCTERGAAHTVVRSGRWNGLK